MYVEVYGMVKELQGKVWVMFLGRGKVAEGSVDEDSSYFSAQAKYIVE